MKCSKQHIPNNKLSPEIFLERAFHKYGTRYTYDISTYKATETPIKIICSKHGEFQQTPYMHLRSKHGCPNCAKAFKGLSNKLNAETFMLRANNIHEFKYIYSSIVYKNTKTNVEIICPLHGNFWQTPCNHFAGYGCPSCGIEKLKKINKQDLPTFISKANKVHNNFYNYSKSIYISSSEKIEIICPIHGSFWQTPGSHLYGVGCIECSRDRSRKPRKSFESFLQQSNNIHNFKYKYTNTIYISDRVPIIVCCPFHGDFTVIPHSHISKKKRQGCPKCSRCKSKGEQKLESILQKLQIKYETQKRFPNCRNKALLRFDFYLPEYNLCIEYDGSVHFIAQGYRTEEDLAACQYRDRLKTNFCKDNKIGLLRILYTQYSEMETILKLFISELYNAYVN